MFLNSLFEISLVMFGILSSTQISDALNEIKIDSRPIVYALKNIMDRFYNNRTSVVFITMQSSQVNSGGLKPAEVAGEMIRINSNRISMTYVIENHMTMIHMQYPHTYNIFLVDSYESFRQVF